MSLKPNGSGNPPPSFIAKEADGSGAKVAEPAIGSALERLQSMYPPEPATEQAKPKTAVNPHDGNLVAGAGVKLKGKIASCNTLTVEGKIDVNVHAHKIVVADRGYVVGNADVEDAEIAGRFEGHLRVSGKLLIRRTGCLRGNVSYGQLEIEPGGQLRGRVDVEKKSGADDGPAEKSWFSRS